MKKFRLPAAKIAPALTALGLLALFAALWAVVQFAAPNLAGNDDYFHIRFAQVMREQGLTPPFPWLPLTILNPADYYDHHFLYHVLLIPFTGGDLVMGAKASAILFGSLAFGAGWLLLRGQNVPYAAIWALGFFALSEAFLYRLSMVRVQAVSLALLLVMLHVTLQGNWRWLLPLAFIYTWLYDAFPLLLAMLAIFSLVRWPFDRRLTLAPLLYAGAGVGLGLIINPYFPRNVIFIYHHILPKLAHAGRVALNVGNEWFPYQSWTLVGKLGPAIVAFLAGALALGLNPRRWSANTAVLFFIAIFFGGLLFKSRRFIEYYPAFALLFCAVAWQPLLAEWRQRSQRLARLLPLILLLVILPLVTFNLYATRQEFITGTPVEAYAGASRWLKENSPPGSLVFQTDWDDFNRLFFYNTHNVYSLGLDPSYMQLYNADLYNLWRETTQVGAISDGAQRGFWRGLPNTDPHTLALSIKRRRTLP